MHPNNKMHITLLQRDIMKIRTLSFVMAILMFSIPLLVFAQQTDDAAQAIIDAQRDAEYQSSLWILRGCCLGIFGIGLAVIYDPPIPASALLGKSPEYINIYVPEYKRQAKSANIQDTVRGCLISSGLIGILRILYVN